MWFIHVFSICVYVLSIASLPPYCLCLLTRSNQITASPWPFKFLIVFAGVAAIEKMMP